MHIIVSEIPSGGLTIDCNKNDLWFQGLAAGDAVNRFQAKEIIFHCLADRIGRQVSLKGEIELHLSAVCSRCLEPFPLSLKGEFVYAMNPLVSRSDGQDDVELAANDLEIGFYDNDLIDLEPIIAEQAFLQLPIKTVCGESCRGICPACGKNLNIYLCDHEVKTKADSPFDVLKNFKVSRKR